MKLGVTARGGGWCLVAALALVATSVTVGSGRWTRPAGATGAAGAAPAATDTGVSTGYQLNPSHDGATVDGWAPPLEQRWLAAPGGPVSYPVIAENKIFVAAPTYESTGDTIWVYDAASVRTVPWGPVSFGTGVSIAGLAYGDGQLFAVSATGLVRSFRVSDGTILWTTPLPAGAYTSAPTFRAGMLYTGGTAGGGTAFGIRTSDGTVVWSHPVAGGEHSSPAVSADGVYVSYGCQDTYKLDPTSGAELWHHPGTCQGSGGHSPVVTPSGVWVRGGTAAPTVLDPATGQAVGTFQATADPAFDGTHGFFLDGSVLTARDPGQPASWTFTGDGQLVGAPIVVAGFVYTTSTLGHIWALDEATGQPVWGDSMPDIMGTPADQGRMTGLGAGQGLVVVPTRHEVVEYGRAYGPVPAKACGINVFGQLGTGITGLIGGRPWPVLNVPGLSDEIAVAGGPSHSLFVAGDGTLWATGWNGVGVLGDGTTTTRSAPVPVPGLTGVKAVAAGELHSLAVTADGSVWGWGWNYFGQLGDGTTTERHLPTRVAGLSGVTQVAGGIYHSLALRSDGTVWAWGWNGVGQLGDGTITDRHVPKQVPGLTGVVAIAAGGDHSLALKSDGSVWAWGWNNYGQLGDGTTATRLRPVPVPGLSGITAVSAGIGHSLALKADGTLAAWGWNVTGQLGDDTTVDRHSPVNVPYAYGITQLAAGGYHSVALDSRHQVWTWGWGLGGQLGDGSQYDRHVPAVVVDFARTNVIGAGWYTTLT